MTIFKYDPNNTEGAYSTAMVIEGAELKKGNKIVATDITDLYDTDINNPLDKQALTYVGDKWINGEVTGGSGCNIFEGYDGYNNIPFNIIQISCGGYHSFAIKIDGTLWGTGRNVEGQLGIGDNIDTITFFDQIGTDNDWKNISCGRYHTIAIKNNGTIWGTGYNRFGQLGLNDNINRNKFEQIGNDNDWEQIFCGDDHTLVIKTDGTLWTTGSNGAGQLGLGDNVDRNVFTQVGTNNDWKFISCGSDHTIAIKNNGTLWVTGWNGYGQLGLGDYNNRYIFTQVGFDNDWKQSDCSYYTMAIKTNGTLWGTGNNAKGQLGLGDNVGRNVFTQIGTNDYYKTISCGVSHTLVINQDNIIWGTGYNIIGQLGLGDNVDRNVFTQVGTNNDWKFISCGSDHTIAIKMNSTVWGTGNNNEGQLGIGDIIHKNIFTQVNIDIVLTNSIFINENTLTPGNGQYDTPFKSLKDCFIWLRNNCTVIPDNITLDVHLLSDLNIDSPTSLNHPYGYNINIHGNGFHIISNIIITYDSYNNMNDILPNLILSDNNSIKYSNIKINYLIYYDHHYYINYGYFNNVSCGDDFVFIIRDDNILFSFGNNHYGQLGLGDYNDRNKFEQVGSDNNWKCVSCGGLHTMAIKTDGTIWGSGSNGFGQFGIGDNITRNVFTKIGNDINWKICSCGGHVVENIQWQ